MRAFACPHRSNDLIRAWPSVSPKAEAKGGVWGGGSPPQHSQLGPSWIQYSDTYFDFALTSIRTYAQIFRFSDFQIFRFSDFQIFGLSDFYGTLLDPNGPYWTLLDPIGPYWTLLDPTEPYWTLLDILLAVPTVVGENILDVFLAVPTVVGENILDVCILEKMTNHFLRPPYKRPRIFADVNPIRKNLGTFIRTSQKVVGHFFAKD